MKQKPTHKRFLVAKRQLVNRQTSAGKLNPKFASGTTIDVTSYG